MLESAFTFQANARAVEQKPRYRNDSHGPNGPCLITVDPRVCRGSTYRKKQVEEEKPKPKPKKRIVSSRDRSLTAGIKEALLAAARRDDRIDFYTQTEPYLQEVVEKPVIITKDTQTDEFLDRPETPPYIPPKNGIDIEIQVVESDLFDFDFEVQPIVSTIVSKTLEQAFLEVHEEEELIAIRRHKEAIERQRNVELADIQRLEEAEKRKFEEKQKRLEQRERVEREQNELRRKIAARGFAEFFASDLVSDAISTLERRGFFYDEVEREIEQQFMPWLEKSMMESSDIKELEQRIIQRVESAAVNFESHLKETTKRTVETNDDSALSKRQEVLRLMFIEDVACAKIRKALAGRVKPQQENNPEEEDA